MSALLLARGAAPGACTYNLDYNCYGYMLPISRWAACPPDASSHCAVQENAFGSGSEGYQNYMMPKTALGKPSAVWGGPSAPGGDGGPGADSCCDDVPATPTIQPKPWLGGLAPAGCCGGQGEGLAERAAGLAVWSVTEPALNIWVHDTPVWYRPGRGPALRFTLTYKHLEHVSSLSNFFGFGPRWSGNFCAYAAVKPGSPNHIAVHHGDGSAIVYDLRDSNEYYSGASIASLDGGGYRVTFRNGTSQEYTAAVVDGNVTRYLLTKVDYFMGDTSDDVGFSYDLSGSSPRLTNITDGAGQRITFAYTNAGPYPSLISRITVPAGSCASFAYNSNGYLTNITDAAGNSSGFVYDSTNGIHQLITPYGTTTLDYTNATDWEDLRVDDLGLRKHLFVYLAQDTNGVIPQAYMDQIPDRDALGDRAYTFETNNLNFRDSFYWAPRQYDALPGQVRTNLDNGTFEPSQLSSNDFLRGRLRHWLLQLSSSNVSHSIGLERAPSLDGTNCGQLTWYDYDGKPDNQTYREGTQRRPRCTALRLPNGQTAFSYLMFNRWGNPTDVDETWSPDASTALIRTNKMTYDDTGRLLLSHEGPDGAVTQYGYDAYDQLVAETNALGEVTTYTYDDGVQLTHHLLQVQTPTLTTCYTYADTNCPGLPTAITNVEISSTTQYTYMNGLVRTNVSPRGLATTYTYDGLGRLTGVGSSEGYTSNLYSGLNLVGTRDRLGNWTRYGYDNYGRLTVVTNALGYTNTYDYCDCGSLSSSTDALGKETYFYYDILGRLTNASYPDGSWVSKSYDPLGRVLSVQDSSGYTVTNGYNIQGLQFATGNANLGLLDYREFDVADRVSKTIDANGVVTTNAYDALGRLANAVKNYTGPEELFSYTSSGLVSVTRDTYTTWSTNDAAGRRIAECNPNGENTFFQYSAAGDLISLTDGKSNTTTWQYDAFGRVTNKSDTLANTVLAYRYDANGRLTNRWTPTKGNTGYCYDALGNLTNVDYATSPDIRLRYDALNRLTNMIDAVGQTRYGYDALGHLTLEDGPWADDAVSYTYTSRQRISLSLQQPGGQAACAQTYAYDSARRLTNITSAAGLFGYAYRAGQVLLPGLISLPGGLSITNDYDDLAWLTGTWLRKTDGTVLQYFTCRYGSGTDRITYSEREAGNWRQYTYDDAGQLRSVAGFDPGEAARPQENFGYSYDAAGNLNSRTNNALVQTFNVNGLNELTSASRSGTMTVAGLVWGTATNVTVNTSNATRYADGSFAKEGFTLVDGTNTFTAVAKDTAGRTDTNSVKPYLPATVTFAYDANGNLRTNSTQILEYDDENQLSRVTQPNAWKSEFTYDGKMRRRERWESVWDGSKWVTNLLVRYIYDGMLVIQERQYNPQLSTTSPQLIVTYTRGRDLSGSFQGAGGIGGLLARTESGPLALGAPLTTALYHADNVGNITCLVATNGQAQGRYLYEPFGIIIGMAGPLADRNLYRFSSKEWHENSALVYYGYRYYSPTLQRWINRDPISEIGHRNVRGTRVNCYAAFGKENITFRFCGNFPTLKYDAFGLWTVEDCDIAHEADKKIIDQAASRCLTSAIKWGVIGEVGFGGGGLIIGTIVGKVPGAGIGLILGTGVNLIVDVCHWRHCEKEVEKMRQDAEAIYQDCLDWAD